MPCVHLQTGEYQAQQARDVHRYLARLTYDDDLEAVVANLARYQVGWIVPGLEGDGVIIADKLAAALGLPGNDPRPPRCAATRRRWPMRLGRPG